MGETNFVTFPLYNVINGKCQCSNPSCDKGGKHAKIRWGQITESVRGEHGHGVCTGERSGIFVVDVDVRPEKGVDGFEDILKLGPMPDTLVVATPTGGFHFYFKWPGFKVRNSAKELAPGVDIRGDGGMVVEAGSPHANGGVYEVVEDLPIADAPEWLLNWPGLRNSKSEKPVELEDRVDLDSDEGAAALDAAIAYLKNAKPSIEGENGHKALWTAARKLVLAFRLPAEVSLALLQEHFNPRCSPEWSERELIHKLNEAGAKATAKPKVEVPEWFQNFAPKTPTQKIAADPPKTSRQTPTAKREYLYPNPNMLSASNSMRELEFNDLRIVLSTHEEWEGVMQYDEFRDKHAAVNPPFPMDCERPGTGITKDDAMNLRSWFAHYGYQVSKQDCQDLLPLICKNHKFHPIVEYLRGCPRAPGILDELAAVVFGVEDPTFNRFLRKTLIAAVRRVLRPGKNYESEKVDTMLVLHGKQGIRKSTFIETLFGEEFTRSQMPELSSKDASDALRGYWAIEIAELDKLLRVDSTTAKDFLARKYDDYRPAYEACQRRFPRQCIFIGTTNETEFLRDPTGERRYWPIPCKKVDIEFVKANRDLIWGEAYYLANRPEAEEPHWEITEDAANLVRVQFQQQNPWENVVTEYVKGKKWVRMEDVYTNAIDKTGGIVKLSSAALRKQVKQTLTDIGCEYRQIRPVKGSDSKLWVWVVPEHLAESEMSPTEKARSHAEDFQRKANLS